MSRIPYLGKISNIKHSGAGFLVESLMDAWKWALVNYQGKKTCADINEKKTKQNWDE